MGAAITAEASLDPRHFRDVNWTAMILFAAVFGGVLALEFTRHTIFPELGDFEVLKGMLHAVTWAVGFSAAYELLWRLFRADGNEDNGGEENGQD